MVLESKTTHDFVMCKCDNQTHVDGGYDYMKVGGVDLNLIKIFPVGPLPKKKLNRRKSRS